MKFGIGAIQRILDIWRVGQVELPRVIRWSRFRERSTKLRQQDCLQHTYSLTVLARILLARLEPYVALDSELILTAALVHDHGEAELSSDIPYPEKTDSRDLDEYRAFLARFEHQGPRVLAAFQRAFLLQFVLKDLPQFHKEAQEVMKELREKRYHEAVFFAALEQLDYVLYAIEQYERYENAEILTEVLTNQISRLDECTRKLPGFGLEIWTNKFRGWCVRFLEAHRGSLALQKQAQV